MSAFDWLLTKLNPVNGRQLAEDGSVVNMADDTRFRQTFDPKFQAVNNGAAILSKTCNVTSEYYYFGLRVPAGREFILFSRTLTLGEGAYRVDAVTSAEGFTGGTPAFKATLKAGAAMTVTSDLICGATPTSAELVVRDEDYVDAGTGRGSARNSTQASVDGLLRIFGPGETGLLRVQRLQAENYTSNIRMVCWERAL